MFRDIRVRLRNVAELWLMDEDFLDILEENDLAPEEALAILMEEGHISVPKQYEVEE